MRDVNAANLTSRPAPPPFTLRAARKATVPAAAETGAPPPAVSTLSTAVQDPIERVIEEAPMDPRRPVRHGLLEQVFFDGAMELRLWWESESPLHKSGIELR